MAYKPIQNTEIFQFSSNQICENSNGMPDSIIEMAFFKMIVSGCGKNAKNETVSCGTGGNRCEYSL